MALTFSGTTALCLFLLLVAVTVEADPNKAKKVKCQDKNFPDCYHVDLYCPDSCLRTCEVDCNSCQPVCPTSPPSPATPTASPSPPTPMPTPSPPPPTPSLPPSSPRPMPKPSPPPPTPTLPPSSPPPTPKPSPPPPAPSSPPPTPKPSPPPPAPTLPPSSPPSTPKPSPPPPTPTLSPPPPTHSPPPSKGKAKCKNRNYVQCYGMYQNCPSDCPDKCEVDCVTCSPVCDCNRPGAVCQDPRFIGGDGITFYFHGKKDHDFCLVTDSNLHINAHFIGRRNQNMKRDFTWVQSLGIMFNTHKLFIGAKKTSTWDDSIDRLSLGFNGEPIFIPDDEGAKWQSTESPIVTITRSRDTNAVVIEVEGNFKIKATVVPITERDSLIHKYGITQEDCFAHLDLRFKFYTLTSEVNGVLGQTYASNYVNRAKMGVAMPVLGGKKEFASSGLFATDCAVARFTGQLSTNNSSYDREYGDLSCDSGMNGRGVVCKR